MDNEKFIDSFRGYQTTGNWLMDLNPLTKLNIALATGFISMLVRDWKFGIVVCVIYFLIAAYVKKLKGFTKSFMAAFVVLGLFTVFVRLISNRGEGNVVFSILGWNWTDVALQKGFDMAFFIVGFAGPIILFFLTTPMKDLTYACEKKGVSATVSYVILVSFKTITELGKSASTILDSQKSRGIETDGNVFVRIKALLPIISPLALSAISYTEEKTIAMDARAFSVTTPHTHLRELKPSAGYEKWLGLFFDLLLVGTVVIKIMGII
ncbi:energy-coupling factor transporter transmembrane component T family protein [Hespellia stercorisuis]|uniref:Energy-coupling factor transport system permease protein n=1 Tax=Hespellia stercorisuis DSM 15480 TaxID=1121950 RepID=A0A1M6KBV8_9FIRM|nr:energy-coupling factor transporter transmembrane component T [Hespellia stercorisuis]SHJ56379.1 energy-coupling factor transport system permease protein [Hespellia stercorisuis DSM 15480]